MKCFLRRLDVKPLKDEQKQQSSDPISTIAVLSENGRGVPIANRAAILSDTKFMQITSAE